MTHSLLHLGRVIRALVLTALFVMGPLATTALARSGAGPAPSLSNDRRRTPQPTPPPPPLTIITAGYRCSHGVCTLGPGSLGVYFAEPVTSSGGKGPTPYTWSVVAGSLPAGLLLTPSYGVYSAYVYGTPTARQTSTFTLQVRDGIGDTARQAFTLTVN